MLALPVLTLLTAGCATIRSETGPDTIEAVLAAPQDLVRSAVIQVLMVGGYSIQDQDETYWTLRTGYRQEIDSPWDGILRMRFGVVRSRVEVTIAPESEKSTRLSIRVTHEGKASFFFPWRPYETPLPQSAANQLRLVKNELGLL
jgi:uncharacterized protein YceK